MESSSANGRWLVVSVTAQTDPACKAMDDATWEQPEVRAWIDQKALAERRSGRVQHLTVKGNKPRTVLTTMYRLRRFFGKRREAGGDRTEAALPGKKLYEESVQGKTKRGQPMSVDSSRNALAEAKTFTGWAVTKRWARANALAEVKGVGKRWRGTPQLTVDEAQGFRAPGALKAIHAPGPFAQELSFATGSERATCRASATRGRSAGPR